MIPSKWSLVFLILLLGIGTSVAQDDYSIEAVLPIGGNIVFQNAGGLIYSVDTLTGTVSILMNYGNSGSVSNLVWSPDGEALTYLSIGDTDSTILDIDSRAIQEIPTFPGQEGIFYPLSWVGSTILYNNPVLGAPGTGTRILNLMDVPTGALTQIASFHEGQVLNGFLLPTYANEFSFSQVIYAEQNPVYDDWVLLQMRGNDPTQVVTDHNGTHALEVSINVLWNYVSDEKISLDTFFSELIDQSSPIRWHPNGEYLFVPLASPNHFFVELLEFDDLSGNWSINQLQRGDPNGVILFDWLGINDLLIGYDYLNSSNEADIYRVGEIIDGEWYSTEFLRIPKSLYPAMMWGDWYLTADEAERHTLSCLFDQALPTRLSIGEGARVNFTTGTPLRLRAELDLNLDPIQQMPEGTGFDVIGGPACVNTATDYYRFWQIQLSDGTVGWAAEAGMTDYFMEPLD